MGFATLIYVSTSVLIRGNTTLYNPLLWAQVGLMGLMTLYENDELILSVKNDAQNFDPLANALKLLDVAPQKLYYYSCVAAACFFFGFSLIRTLHSGGKDDDDRKR